MTLLQSVILSVFYYKFIVVCVVQNCLNSVGIFNSELVSSLLLEILDFLIKNRYYWKFLDFLIENVCLFDQNSSKTRSIIVAHVGKRVAVAHLPFSFTDWVFKE